MDYDFIANSLMDTLEQDIKETPILIARGQEYRRRGQWPLATQMAEQHRKRASSDTTQEAEFWLVICDMYRGATMFSGGAFERARDFFRTAELGFRIQQHRHGRMVALLAQGRAYQIDHAPDEAASIYIRCEQMCADLEQRATLLHEFSSRQAYANLRHWWQNATVRLRESAFPRLVCELDVIAGEPAYLLADDDPCQTARVFIDGELLGLRGCENGRTEIACSLNPCVRYFVAHVRGDSMQGTTRLRRQIDIRSGDRLLVRFEEGQPPNETIGVFKEADRSPIVKIFRQRPPLVILASANPLYRDRVFDANAPQVRYLGPVLAILEESS